MLPVMAERLLALALAARDARMGLNIDAEEADRLDLSLDVIERVLAEPELAGWNGFGVVVQAYGPRAPSSSTGCMRWRKQLDRKIMVRLVKGAYWDTEIKRAQTLGLDGYPVFTRKANTDVSYIACARKLLSMTDRIYPQFATHNAHTVAAILAMAPDRDSFEFQRLHGMGEQLHEAVRKAEGTRCRIYAPVGAHSDLLAYLVRRLLENGANSSFVHQMTDEDVPPEAIARDPFEVVDEPGTGRQSGDREASRDLRRGPAEFEGLRHHRPGRAGRHRQGQGGLCRQGALVGRADHARRRLRLETHRSSIRPSRRMSSAPSPKPAPSRFRPPCASPSRRSRPGPSGPSPSARRSCAAPPISTRRTPSSSSRWRRARPARRWPTASPKCARRSTSCATTRPRRRMPKPEPRRAAPSSASRHGIFRWRSSPARSRPRSSPAIR